MRLAQGRYTAFDCAVQQLELREARSRKNRGDALDEIACGYHIQEAQENSSSPVTTDVLALASRR